MPPTLTQVGRFLAVVELEIPVQIVAPALRCVSKADRDAHRRRRIGPPRVRDQTHVRFFWRAPALLAVARHATRDDILPVLPAALCDRDDVVECQFAGGCRVAAVLAAVMV